MKIASKNERKLTVSQFKFKSQNIVTYQRDKDCNKEKKEH